MAKSAKPAGKPPPPRRGLPAAARRILLGLLLLGPAAWTVLAVYYGDLPESLRLPAAVLAGLVPAMLLIAVRSGRRALALYCTAFFLILAWWLAIPPSNDRDWQPDVAVLPWAELRGDDVTIHNIRDCDYRTEFDYTVRHYDKSFDLKDLRTADLSVVYWGSPLIAHTMLSFGFADDAFVCISIETRKSVGESYSALKGFFRQYELTYVVADERDLIRLRTNYRGEDVYLYRLKAEPELIRSVFLDYLRQVNRLQQRPEWYNALTENCTTSIRGHTLPYNPDARLDWRILVNGFIDEMAYERGLLFQGLPFPELKALSRVNERAVKAGADPLFSRRIREGLPGMEPAGP